MVQVIPTYGGYECEVDGRQLVPRRAAPAKLYLWYRWGHRPFMLEMSRKQGSPYHCGLHPDGRCTRGWDEDDGRGDSAR